MVTCANGHPDQIPGANCSVCGLALPAAGVAVWGQPSTSSPASPALPAFGSEGTDPHWPRSAPSTPSHQGSSRRSRRKFPILVAAIALAVIAAGGGSYFLFTHPVPDVVGARQDEARDSLMEAGFGDVTMQEEFSSTTIKGLVSAQEPQPGARVTGDQRVVLTISRGQAASVPDVGSSAVGVARQEIRAADLEYREQSQTSSTVPAGRVISQNPPPGTQLEVGATVTVVYSLGPPTTTVTATLDLSDIVLDDLWTDCSEALSYLKILFSNPRIENGVGSTLSRISGPWRGASGNGEYFPCVATAEFPNTSTEESLYVLNLDPPAAVSSTAPSWTRNELERNGWVMSYR